MRPASAISWGLWLNPGGHSSKVANLIKFFIIVSLFWVNLKLRFWQTNPWDMTNSSSIIPAGKRCKLRMPGPSVDKHPWRESRLSKQLLNRGRPKRPFQLNSWHFMGGWRWYRCWHHWISLLANLLTLFFLLFFLINLDSRIWSRRSGLAP